jgi:hypothetical protein
MVDGLLNYMAGTTAIGLTGSAYTNMDRGASRLEASTMTTHAVMKRMP